MLSVHLSLAATAVVALGFAGAANPFAPELIRDRVWRTHTQLELATVEYVAWFNTQRLHSSLANIPPIEHEAN